MRFTRRNPKSTVVALPGGRKRIGKAVSVDVDATSADAPHDDTVRVIPMDGCTHDVLLEVRSADGVTLVFCDAVLNVAKRSGLVGLITGSGHANASQGVRESAGALPVPCEPLPESQGSLQAASVMDPPIRAD